MCQYYQSNWDEPGSFEECRDYVGVANKLEEIEKSMKRLIDIIYGDAEIDLGDLDDAIGCICDACGVDMPTVLPNVRRIRSALFEMAAGMYKQEKTI
jgi:hypothetical protein